MDGEASSVSKWRSSTGKFHPQLNLLFSHSAFEFLKPNTSRAKHRTLLTDLSQFLSWLLVSSGPYWCLVSWPYSPVPFDLPGACKTISQCFLSLYLSTTLSPTSVSADDAAFHFTEEIEAIPIAEHLCILCLSDQCSCPRHSCFPSLWPDLNQPLHPCTGSIPSWVPKGIASVFVLAFSYIIFPSLLDHPQPSYKHAAVFLS